MPTINELIQHALPSGVTVRAGRAGLGRNVTRVVRIVPGVVDARARAGEIGLLSAFDWEADNGRWAIRDVVDQLTDPAAAGVALIGAPDSDTERLAERRATPLLVLPESTSADMLELSLQWWLFERRAAMERQVRALRSELGAAVAAGAGLPQLADRLAQQTGKSVLLHDADWQILHQSQPPLGALPQRQIQAALRATDSAAAQWGVRAAERGAISVGVASFEVAEHALVRLVAAVRLDDELCAFLTLLGRAEETVENDHLQLQAVSVAAGPAPLVLRPQPLWGSPASLSDGFSRGALDQFAVQARGTKVRGLSGQYLVLAMHHPSAGDAQFADAVADVLGAASTLLYPDGARVLALVPVAPRGPVVRGWREQATTWHMALSARLGNVSIGCSGRRTGEAGLSKAVMEAAQALTLGESLYGVGHLVSYWDAVMLGFLLGPRSHQDRQGFHERVLGPLLAYDRAENAELVSTLDAFFACCCSTQATAERLQMHRNSVLYRLKRIEEVAQVDLDDPDTRLLLQTALRLGRTPRPALVA